MRWSDFRAFYSADGAFPLELLLRGDGLFWNRNSWSVFLLNSSSWYLHLLFATAAFSSMMLLIGYRTRLFSILVWIWLVSVQNRVPVILQGGDDYLRLIVFWGIFLPWGRCYSADSFELPSLKTQSYFNLPVFALLLQIVFLYLFTALLKHGPEWHSEGSALYYAMSLDQLVKPIGKLIYPYSSFLTWGTHAAITTEFLIPILILIPWHARFFRTVALILLIALHVFIEVTMQVGLFSFICIAASFSLIPAEFYSRTGRFFSAFKATFLRAVYQLNYMLPYRSKQEERTNGIVANSLVMVGVLMGLTWNIHSAVKLPDTFMKNLETVAVPFGWNQNWGMFAPSVFKDDGWYIYEAVSGSDTIDLLKGGRKVDYGKPELAVRQYKSARWRKFGENLIFVDHIPMRPYFCEYLLKNWNRKHPEKTISTLRVLYMMEVTLPDYKTKPISREYLCDCRDTNIEE